MRIGVIGAGAVGGTIAALLDRGGHDVHVTARGDQLRVIEESGLRLTGAWGEHVARIFASETLTRKPDIALLCVKAQDAASAIAANREALMGVPVVVVQNGLSGVGEAKTLLPDSECIGALALYAASYLRTGTVSITTPGPTYLGYDARNGEPHTASALEQCAAVLGAVMPAVVTDNFIGTQWTKLVVNQVNAMPAITGMSAQDTIGHAGLRRVIIASMREAVRVGLANGVHFGELKPMNHRMLRALAVAPLWLGQIVPLMMAKRMGSVPNPGSTLQSLKRGQPTEIDFLNGAVVKAASAVSRTARVNATIVELVHEVERSRDFLSPSQVVARFP